MNSVYSAHCANNKLCCSNFYKGRFCSRVDKSFYRVDRFNARKNGSITTKKMETLIRQTLSTRHCVALNINCFPRKWKLRGVTSRG